MLPRRIAAAALLALTLPGAALPAIAAEGPRDPAALLRAWAAAYASIDGPRVAALYTEDARLWDSTSREQTVGREAIAGYFGRTRPGAASISVVFGKHAIRTLADGVAVASGHYTFIRGDEGGGAKTRLPSRFSMAMVRGQGGVWRIADHHSSRLPEGRQAG